jgi:formylglycine-generating enzyme required for sulfatase activity
MTKASNDEFEVRIDYYLVRRELSRKRLAELLRIHPSYLTHLVKGDRRWTDDLFTQTCKFLNLNDNEINELWRIKPQRKASSAPALDPDEYEPDMVLIPAGEFRMGSEAVHDPMAELDELPCCSLFVPDFCISRSPVTNTQYLAFVRSINYPAVPRYWGKRQHPPPGKEDHPVVWVSWNDANEYCKWLSSVTGKHYRLPSEAEWEKAARGTDGRIFPWGNELPDKSRCNYDTQGAKNGGTTAAGDYPPGANGLFDMSGNVWEWTSSLHKDYPYKADAVHEHQGTFAARVVRGGSFMDVVKCVRCACRSSNNPVDQNHNRGFRIVLEAG